MYISPYYYIRFFLFIIPFFQAMCSMCFIQSEWHPSLRFQCLAFYSRSSTSVAFFYFFGVFFFWVVWIEWYSSSWPVLGLFRRVSHHSSFTYSLVLLSSFNVYLAHFIQFIRCCTIHMNAIVVINVIRISWSDSFDQKKMLHTSRMWNCEYKATLNIYQTCLHPNPKSMKHWHLSML